MTAPHRSTNHPLVVGRRTTLSASCFALLGFWLTTTTTLCFAFVPSSSQNHYPFQGQRWQRSLQASSSSTPAPEQILDEEQRKNLFQFLLRDLQVEGVPLLGIDGADQVETMQVALWTTMAELWTSYDRTEQQKACLIFEDLPVDALRAFVDSFANIQAEDRLTQHWPELKDFDLSLVGKGVGPAILVKVGEDTKKEGDHSEESAITDAIDVTPEASAAPTDRVIAALEHFIERVVMHSDDGIGLQADKAVFRVANTGTDVCHLLSSFWNGMCELQTSPSISSVVLGLVSIEDSAKHVALSELINRSLCLYRGDSVFELVHYHPEYDRNDIFPQVQPVFGHLPPAAWQPLIVEQFGDSSSPPQQKELELVNYQRRSPVPAVILKRVENMEEGDAEELDLGDGNTVPAKGISNFAKSITKLVQKGESALQKELEEEIAMWKYP